MSFSTHKYTVQVAWTGNRGSGTSGYAAYGRQHVISSGAKPDIAGSADPSFRGNADRWNPEDLVVAAAAACHKLWYLHLCADAGIAVMSYCDEAVGTMVDTAEEGRFTKIVLHPHVHIRSGDDIDKAHELHHAAQGKCYVANSVNFPISCEPVIEFAIG